MAHFAEIDESNIVLRVLVVPDLHELRGQSYLANDMGLGGTWIQTSYNGNIRCNFAEVNSIYDPIRDVFYRQKPFSSWELDDKCVWQAPTPKPTDGNIYTWNETNLTWEKTND